MANVPVVLSARTIDPMHARRIDARGVVHAAYVLAYDKGDKHCWAPVCGIRSGGDTVSVATYPETPEAWRTSEALLTCLLCLQMTGW